MRKRKRFGSSTFLDVNPLGRSFGLFSVTCWWRSERIETIRATMPPTPLTDLNDMRWIALISFLFTFSPVYGSGTLTLQSRTFSCVGVRCEGEWITAWLRSMLMFPQQSDDKSIFYYATFKIQDNQTITELQVAEVVPPPGQKLGSNIYFDERFGLTALAEREGRLFYSPLQSHSWEEWLANF